MDEGSEVAVVVVFQILSRFFFFRTLLFFLFAFFVLLPLVSCPDIFLVVFFSSFFSPGVASCEAPHYFWLQQPIIQFLHPLEILHLLILNLFLDLFKLLFSFHQFLFLSFVIFLQFLLQIVNVPVFLHIYLVHSFQLLFQSLVLFHKGWFYCDQTFVTFLCSL